MALVCRRDSCKGLAVCTSSAAGWASLTSIGVCVAAIVAPLLRNALASAPAFLIVDGPRCWQAEQLTYIQVYISNFLSRLSVGFRLRHAKALGIGVLIGHPLAKHDRANFDALLSQPRCRILVPGSGRLHASQQGSSRSAACEADDVKGRSHGLEVDQGRLQGNQDQVGHPGGGAGRIHSSGRQCR